MTEVAFLEEYDLKLDEQQAMLLCAQKHPILVDGTTGSGKTFLFLSRIAYFIKSGIANKEEMLNLVFDKPLALKMTAQYQSFFGADNTPLFTDIYSFAYQLIRQHCEEQGTTVHKAYKDMSSAVKRLCEELFKVTLHPQQTSCIMHLIRVYRNQMIPLDTLAQRLPKELHDVDLAVLYNAFVQFKEKKALYDYDDVLAVAIELLQKDHELLLKTQAQCQFLQVDDAQELSNLSHRLINLLAENAQELMLFADASVSYAQRATESSILTEFMKAYPNGEIIKRRINYRNNATILAAANHFFYPPENQMQGVHKETCDLRFKGFSDVSKLYAYGLKRVQEEEGEIAFLYRNFAMAVPLIELFKKQGISFHFQGNMKRFLQHPFVREMWNFIELLVDPRDMRAFYEVYEAMGLDISKRVLLEVSERLKTEESIDVYQALMESSYKLAGKKKLASLMERIRMAEHQSTLDMVLFIKEKIGYNEYLRTFGIAPHDPVILAFEVLAERYEDPDEFLYQLGSLKDYQTEPTSRITICSLADARGKDYDMVCILDCIRHILPEQEENEIERCLMFNGITRAKHQLEFFAAKRCGQHRLEISPYLHELHDQQQKDGQSDSDTANSASAPKKLRLAALKRGVSIRHVQMGEGKITKIEDGMMQVMFADGAKQMNMKLCIANQLIELCS